MNSNSIQLQQPVTEPDSIRSVNFFNGRLLTGKDFSREQQARSKADWQLGLASGEGVSFGLQVDETTSNSAKFSFIIKAGLAFNSEGQALRLSTDQTLVLIPDSEKTDKVCLFNACNKFITNTYTGAGVYVLTIAPTEKIPEGKALSNSLDPANVRCNTDVMVEAVQFRLLKIKPETYSDLHVGQALFRNELAYRCFGAGIQASWFENLLDAKPRQNDLLESLRLPQDLLDDLRKKNDLLASLRKNNMLSPLEVPLALLCFSGAENDIKLKFVDNWAVRRTLSHRNNDALTNLIDTHRLVIGQAMFQQFQAQIAGLKLPNAEVTAQTHFRYLPPVGIIPVAEETNLTDAQATKFFTGMTYRSPVFINAARVESLIRESLCYPPIDTQSGEILWLYRVRENRMAIKGSENTKKPRSYLIFASGHLPYVGDAQFNLARWNYSNYALAR